MELAKDRELLTALTNRETNALDEMEALDQARQRITHSSLCPLPAFSPLVTV